MTDGFTHYTSNMGILELREAISHKLNTNNGIQSNPESILVTVGASEAIYMCMQALVNPGDEVLVPGPWFLILPGLCNSRRRHTSWYSTQIG